MPHELLDLQCRTLFLVDERNRLLSVNEPGQPPAPRLWVGRSAAGNLWRVRYDVSETLVARIDAILRDQPATAELESAPQCRDALLALLAPASDEYRGPAFMLPERYDDPHPAVALHAGNIACVRTYFPWMEAALGTIPMAAVIVEGMAVSVCFSSRVGSRADEAGLETAPAYRRQGFAAPAVKAWAQIVRSQGRMALYSTSWSNHASRAVARKLGAQLYGEDWSIA